MLYTHSSATKLLTVSYKDSDPDLDTDRNESTNVPISKLRIETKPKRFDVFQNLKWNVSVYSKNFGTKPKLIDVF